MIRLRPHHLLCLLTYAGKGYSTAFVQNFDAIASRLASDSPWIEVVEGPDEVCQPLLGSCDHHCEEASVRVRDRLAAEDLMRLLGRIEAPTLLLTEVSSEENRETSSSVIAPGARLALTADRLQKMREAFRRGEVRRACAGCPWHGFCDEIAAQGFATTRLLS